jgi:Mg-chelatase subunit ChlD
MTDRMKRRSIAPWLALLLLLIATAGVRGDAGLSDGLKPDVRLLIDISGSMKDSDPENLRAPALDLIVRLLPEGSKAGVWSFGHEVELLVEHRVVDSSWRKNAAQAVAEIDNSGLLTNIPAALEAALYDFDRLDPTYRTSIILLTDGKVDISESPMTNAIAARLLLATQAPALGAAGIPVHTIALSDEADWAFLTSLAKATGGIAE